MTHCERCKEKITPNNSYIFHETKTGETKKFCQSCAVIIKTHTTEKKNIMRKKELEDAFYKVTKEPVQKMEKSSQPESESFTREDMKTEDIETHEIRKGTAEFVTRDQILNKIKDYLNDEPLKIGDDDYYFIRIVGKHLEIGRTKISLER